MYSTPQLSVFVTVLMALCWVWVSVVDFQLTLESGATEIRYSMVNKVLELHVFTTARIFRGHG